jgi:hypothetical protein
LTPAFWQPARRPVVCRIFADDCNLSIDLAGCQRRRAVVCLIGLPPRRRPVVCLIGLPPRRRPVVCLIGLPPLL